MAISKVKLTTGITGTLPVANGGTNLTSGFVNGGVNTPAFHAYLSANQDINSNVNTKVQCNTEVYDTDNCYDNSTNYRFTPTTAGKYYVYATLIGQQEAYVLYYSNPMIYKNGSEVARTSNTIANGAMYAKDSFVSVVVDMNGTSDYVEFFGVIDIHAHGQEKFVGTGSFSMTSFGAYKIIE